jgi:uncharacterized small protein (DUF1192 family)
VETSFEGQLRRNIQELVRSRVGLLEQEISRLQREVNQAFTSLLERTDSAASIPESDELLARIAAEVNARIGQASAESARLNSALALLRDSVDELGRQTTQAEVLNTLVARASLFAPRLVLFVIKGNNALAWAARGFDGRPSEVAIRGFSVPLQADTALRAAFNSQQTFYGSPDQQSENQLLLGRFGGQPLAVLSVPLKVRSKVAAVLYADSADRGPEAITIEAIELLVAATGQVVELISLRGRVGEAARQTASPAQTAEASTRPTTGPLPAKAGSGQPDMPPPPTFFKPAEPQTAQAETARPPESPKPIPAPIGSQEERLHMDARRFARLLVSEIKLYNEQKVEEGRRNKDLYERLKEDIDRSRQMYDKRVAPSVAATVDYFYDELVNTLAEGDPSKLGPNSPGPSIRQ